MQHCTVGGGAGWRLISPHPGPVQACSRCRGEYRSGYVMVWVGNVSMLAAVILALRSRSLNERQAGLLSGRVSSLFRPAWVAQVLSLSLKRIQSIHNCSTSTVSDLTRRQKHAVALREVTQLSKGRRGLQTSQDRVLAHDPAVALKP